MSGLPTGQEPIGDENISNDNANSIIDGSDNNKQDDKVILPSDNVDIDNLKNAIKENLGYPDFVIEKLSDSEIIEISKGINTNNTKEPTDEDNTPNNNSNENNQDDKQDDNTENINNLWEQVNKEALENGFLISEELYDKLNAMGIPDEVIDNYIEGLETKAKYNEVINKETISKIAGEDAEDFIKWVQDKEGIDVENALKMLSPEEVSLYAKSYYLDYMLEAKNNNNTNQRIIGNTNIGSNFYASKEDYLLDVMDSRYGVDAKYTKAVDEKFRNSNF